MMKSQLPCIAGSRYIYLQAFKKKPAQGSRAALNVKPCMGDLAR